MCQHYIGPGRRIFDRGFYLLGFMSDTDIAKSEIDKQKRDESRRRELLAALFVLLLTDTDSSLRAHALAFLTGTATVHATAHAFATTLAAAHGHAAYLGRRLAGATAPFGFADAQFGASVARTQVPYAQGLLDDLEGGRYPLVDGALAGALANRLLLYARRLLGTANEAWTATLPPDTMLDWVLGEPETHHCATCPARAAEGPYRAGAVTFQPGDGTSECGTMCLCHWEIVGGGSSGFVLPEDTISEP